jgi:hypothetical protein
MAYVVAGAGVKTRSKMKTSPRPLKRNAVKNSAKIMRLDGIRYLLCNGCEKRGAWSQPCGKVGRIARRNRVIKISINNNLQDDLMLTGYSPSRRARTRLDQIRTFAHANQRKHPKNNALPANKTAPRSRATDRGVSAHRKVRVSSDVRDLTDAIQRLQARSTSSQLALSPNGAIRLISIKVHSREIGRM